MKFELKNIKNIEASNEASEYVLEFANENANETIVLKGAGKLKEVLKI